MRVQKQVDGMTEKEAVLQLLKSWEYKNGGDLARISYKVLQLLKSWEYKNLHHTQLTN